jgi:hypothetical protein
MYEYRVVPFVASSPPNSSSEQRRRAAADQFQSALAAQMAEGFEYFRMDHYHQIEQPGCLRAFFGLFFGGGGPIVLAYDVAVFRRPRG